MAEGLPERSQTRKKELGAYYTAPAVVEYLVGWGLKRSPGVVMDPSCGDGRFLEAAARRGAAEIIGCDLDADALAAAQHSHNGFDVPSAFHATDFFMLEPKDIGPIDLLVGNPPFIRYQHFRGETRSRALASALRVGARLSRLAASWAPFLLHALQFLRPGGCMGMVVPAELAQTLYGIETLRALCGNFGRIRLITFRHNWFVDAQQETFLLLAEDRGASCGCAELIALQRIDELAAFGIENQGDAAFRLELDAAVSLGYAFLEPAARHLLLRLMGQSAVVPLKSLGDVANGYVSGANDFFHCTSAGAAARGLPEDWLLPVARNSRSLTGLAFDTDDVTAAERAGRPHHLILPLDGDLFSDHRCVLNRLIQDGEETGIAARYKCRLRTPWWRVPGLVRADLFLPYMIGNAPHAAVNRCHALYPNSLHGLRLFSTAIADRVAFGLLTSLSLLSMELEGRSYGGGVLKLEPTEMERVQLVLPKCGEPELRRHFVTADQLIRDGDFIGATRLADREVLQTELGLSDSDLQLLRRAQETLRERRETRARRVT